MANVRTSRVNSEMQTLLAQIIKNDLNDPRLEGAIISVLKVNVVSDLSHAKINLSIFSAKNSDEAFKAILNSVPFIRRTLARKMQLRIMPELHFVLDTSLDYASKIDGLLNKIKND
ncbi:MAG: 30S ribosome-binding factor RbfA [Clostridia bacterium]|nr:30S ribosome-binding factor RbfA [Clostridia bacterium]